MVNSGLGGGTQILDAPSDLLDELIAQGDRDRDEPGGAGQVDVQGERVGHGVASIVGDCGSSNDTRCVQTMIDLTVRGQDASS